jgi:hypothetical protein
VLPGDDELEGLLVIWFGYALCCGDDGRCRQSCESPALALPCMSDKMIRYANMAQITDDAGFSEELGHSAACAACDSIFFQRDEQVVMFHQGENHRCVERLHPAHIHYRSIKRFCSEERLIEEHPEIQDSDPGTLPDHVGLADFYCG